MSLFLWFLLLRSSWRSITFSSTVWPKYATTSATTRDAVASSSPVLLATWRTRSCGYVELRGYASSIDAGHSASRFGLLQIPARFRAGISETGRRGVGGGACDGRPH